MQNNFFTINIHEFLADEQLTEALRELIASFDCSKKNEEVDDFLKNSSIDFAKKGQSATYFVFRDMGNDAPIFVGFFTLAVKPITVPKQYVNSKNARRLERVSHLNEENNSYHLAAYLIAQLGKNFSIEKNCRSAEVSCLQLPRVKYIS